MGVKNFTLSRLNRPPIRGKKGAAKVDLSMLGVTSITGPDSDGMYSLRAGDRIKGRVNEDLNSIASPDADIAFYISTAGAHSVVYYQDIFWAVMAVKRKYKYYDSKIGQNRFLYQDIILVKPGSSFKHSTISAEWSGLSIESEKFIKECIEEIIRA